MGVGLGAALQCRAGFFTGSQPGGKSLTLYFITVVSALLKGAPYTIGENPNIAKSARVTFVQTEEVK